MNVLPTQPDILVVGGGAAGIAAAIGAAHAGATVLLVEQAGYLGGMATAANVGTICGLWRRRAEGPLQTANEGFPFDFAADLAAASGTVPTRQPDGLAYLPYDAQQFRLVADRTLASASVDVLLHATVCGVEHRANRIDAVSVLAVDGLHRIAPGAVVDCTGAALITRLCGAPLRPDTVRQAASLSFALAGVNWRALHDDFPASDSDGEDESVLDLLREDTAASADPVAALGREIALAVARGRTDGDLPSEIGRFNLAPGQPAAPTLLHLKFSPLEPLAADAVALARLEARSRVVADITVAYLRRQVPALANATLCDVAARLGVRGGALPVGRDTLTVADVRSCRKRPDGVARGTWPIEYWHNGRRPTMTWLPEDDYYDIPADALRSATMENLHFAGRSFSAEPEALGSARVIGTCLATGLAAGRLAVEDLVANLAGDIATQAPLDTPGTGAPTPPSPATATDATANATPSTEVPE